MTRSQDCRAVTGAWIGMCALLASACGDAFEATAPPTTQESRPQSASAKPAATGESNARAKSDDDPSSPANSIDVANPSTPPPTAAGAGSASSNAEHPNAQPAATPTQPPPHADRPPTAAGAAYPGHGFIVHEWGTNTVVVGSDGSLQRGLQHPGNDLPAFVYDRLSQGDALGFPTVDKMETPVDYFYSERPLSLRVRVDMPNGVLTEWYPAVETFAPGIVMPGMGPLLDPLMEPDYPYMSQQCLDKYAKLAPGKLDWGTVEVLDRNAPTDALPAAPLDRYTWSHAREVDANLVRTINPTAKDAQGTTLRTPQSERFLFYRGLGNFEPPLRVREEAGSAVLTKQTAWRSPGPAFVLRVTEEDAAFARLDDLPDEGSATQAIPAAPDMPIDAFVEQLAREMTAALSGTGLYRDEALAMVNTWRRQWFRTPGVRVLYFAPQSWIDREVPLTITPVPDITLRVMVMRVELLTTETEAADLAAAIDLNSATEATAAREYFRALGRFAEPRLRRAIWALGGRVTPEALALLAEIEGPAMSWAGGE